MVTEERRESPTRSRKTSARSLDSALNDQNVAFNSKKLDVSLFVKCQATFCGPNVKR